ncbi:spore germination protein PE [Gracilibacillus halotolerans]|uniref:Spore germination protein PE n=1 Tax=Gracilibacillus halotolerans TaxID=74386 RepID=A0A841RLY5_9BACI|nr:spore germination protein GerPE [Gracilibacillus halotolerans]MBB6512633.1 spore germination protein PE [Gracilibacillus halotolerans]
MDKRATRIRYLDVETVSFSSIVQIGDSRSVKPSADILAVQKSGQPPSDLGFAWDRYPIFQTKLLPKIRTNIIDGDHFHASDIKIRKVDVLGVSASSIIHVGNTSHVNSLARTKHIRLVHSNDHS